MCTFIYNTSTHKYLAYDGETKVIIWVVGQELAHCFSSIEEVNIVLSLLNSNGTNVYVGRPGDRGGNG